MDPGAGAGFVFGMPGNGAGQVASAGRMARASSSGSVALAVAVKASAASMAAAAVVRRRMARHPTRGRAARWSTSVIYSSARRSWPKRVSVRRSESVSSRRM